MIWDSHPPCVEMNIDVSPTENVVVVVHARRPDSLLLPRNIAGQPHRLQPRGSCYQNHSHRTVPFLGPEHLVRLPPMLPMDSKDDYAQCERRLGRHQCMIAGERPLECRRP